jgi:pimeloyl-[acyl-carrier protein] methyl ester esterase
MPFVKTPGGIEWSYEIFGAGAGNVLFIHGWGMDHRIWKQQIKHFRRRYRVMGLDLPGHGQSGFERLSLSDMAHGLREVLIHAGFSPCFAVGSSMGGLLALKFHELFPNAFGKITFVGSAPKFSRSEDYPCSLDVERIRRLAGQVDTRYPDIVEVFFRSLFTREERRSRRYLWLQKFRRRDSTRPDQSALLHYLDILEKEDLRHILPGINVPLQFINGSGDEICTPATVEYIRKIAPCARYDEFERCGHFPFLTNPYGFNAVLEDFLK